jgi:hypothetical protein
MLEGTAAAQLVSEEGHERSGLPTRQVLVLVIIACCAFLALAAEQQIRAAHAALLQGAEDLRGVGLQPNLAALPSHPQQLAFLRRRVAAAETSFGSARADLGPWAPLLDRLGWLPSVGPEAEAAGPSADAGYHATRSALMIFDGLQPVIGDLVRPRHGDRLARLTAGLARSEPRFELAAAEADAAVNAAGRLPSTVGNHHLDTLLERVRIELPRLQNGAHLLAAAPTLLGVGRPAHYLFAWENPAELRATGGFIGAVDYLTVRDGRVSHRFFGHILPHEITTAELPLPEAVYTPEDYWLFCDSNWSPSFPLTARFERWFYGEDTGSWADGVIDFVDTGISPILRATGPVYLPGYRRWVTAGNVQALAQQYINGRYKGPSNSGLPETIRKQFFRAVMVALVARFQHLSLPALGRLTSTLKNLIAQRDLLLYDQHPALEQQITQAGADGGLRPVAGDFLMVVDDNRSYNKINPSVTETGSYSAAVSPDGSIQSTLRLHYTLHRSPADLEGYGPDWGRWGTKHDYQDFLRVFVPAGARLLSLSGADLWAPQPAYGLTQFAARLLLREGESTVVTLRYTTPGSALGALSRPAYRLTVQRQPGADLTAIRVSVRGMHGVSVGSAGAPEQVLLQLSRDARLDLRLTGGRIPAASISTAMQPDPYVAFASLHDPRHAL